MINLNKYLISEKDCLHTALVQLNKVSTMGLTLFVIDNDRKLLGSITDGDIRRALINGIDQQESVTQVMNKNPYSIVEGKDNVLLYKQIRNKNISVIPVVNANGEIVDIYDVKQTNSVLPIDAVLMAGGKGERLRPLTETCPKPLLKVGNKAIIDYNIDNLINCGVKHISVTVNYLKEQIEEHFSQPRSDIKINTVREPKFLGTAGGIMYIEDFYNDTILLMNSDLFTNINFEDFYIHFKQHNADMSAVAIPYAVSVPFGIFDLEGDDIKGLFEKPTYNYYANAGIYLIKRELLDLVPKDTFFNATDLMELLINKGYKVTRFLFNGTWIDIGRIEEYNRVCEIVKEV